MARREGTHRRDRLELHQLQVVIELRTYEPLLSKNHSHLERSDELHGESRTNTNGMPVLRAGQIHHRHYLQWKVGVHIVYSTAYSNRVEQRRASMLPSLERLSFIGLCHESQRAPRILGRNLSHPSMPLKGTHDELQLAYTRRCRRAEVECKFLHKYQSLGGSKADIEQPKSRKRHR
jgi:hypothetical protein